MEIRKEMSPMDPNKAPVSFHDVAAYFSEEEWKLLHDWQTELYEIVMKEIHQAMTLLGPLIATSVFSLRPKPKEDVFPLEPQEPEIRGSTNCSPRLPFHDPDLIVKKKPKFGSCLIDQHPIEGRDIGSSPSSEHVFAKSDVPFLIKDQEACCIEDERPERQKQTCADRGPAIAASAASFSEVDEGEIYSTSHHDSERWGGITDVADDVVNKSVVTFKIKEEGESYFGNNPHADMRDVINSPTGHDDRPVVSFVIKEDGMTYSMDQRVLATGRSTSTRTDKEVTKRKRKERYSTKGTENAPPCKATLGRPKTNVPPSSNYAPESARLQEAGIHHEQGEQSVPWDTFFRMETHSNLHPSTVQSMTADIYKEWESNANNSNFSTCAQNGTPYANTECEQSFTHKEGGLQVLHSGLAGINPKQNRCYQSIKYGNIYNRIKNRIGQPRTHSTGRLFHCTKCDKSFSHVASRNRHQSTHSEGKIYQCSECEKIFNRKDNLTRHQKSHSGGICTTDG